MRLLYTVILLSLWTHNVASQARASIGVFDFLNSVNTFLTGVGQEVLNGIPTPEELLNIPKQILFGLTETIVFQTFNQLCSLYMAADTIRPRITPNIESMTLKLRTPCKTLTFTLKQAGKILQSPYFDVNKQVVIFVTGWLQNPEKDYVAEMANAYHCRGNNSFLVLDSSDSIDTLYTWSAYNTEEVGRYLAMGLKKLVKEVPAKNIHLIGHSLGAHIVGYAGRYFNELTGLKLKRITGLDPANPCFSEGNKLTGLQRGDAHFIDIIHSNPGALGKEYPIGDADFYPEGLDPIKPGCIKFGCSHGRAFSYFIESVYPGNGRNFLAVRCTSLEGVNKGFCKGKRYPMGYKVPHNLKGNYFLSVNAEKPYGKNHRRQNVAKSTSGKCKQSKTSQ